MNIKKAGLYTGIFLGSFIVVLVVLYFLYPVIEPERAEMIQAESEKEQVDPFDPEQYSIRAVEELSDKVKELRGTVDSLKQKESDYLAAIDSLKEINSMKKNKPSGPDDRIPDEKKPEEQMQAKKDAAKSLLNLDEEDLIPIVNLLTEKQLIDLYSFASAMQKEKLLRSLEPQKAAKILNKVMS